MADTTQTIQKFYTQAQKWDFSRDVLFRVISIKFGDTSTQTLNEDELIYAQGGKIPGRNIGTTKVPFMGLDFNVPTIAKYTGSDNYELTFYCDMNSTLRDKFEQISRDTFDDETSTGNYFMPKAGAVIDLLQLDTQLNVVKHYQLVGVAIKNVGEQEYKINGEGQVVTFKVAFTYHYYRIVE